MIQFDKEKHEYTLNGKVLISTTQLLSKFGLAPSYDGVNSDLLKASSEKGTLIHEEIETFIKTGEVGFTEELFEFIKFFNENNLILADLKSEHLVYNDVVAGTVDFIYTMGGNTVIADFKTTLVLHKNTVEWQLSIYAYLYDRENYEKFIIQAFHFTPKLAVVNLRLKPKAEVEKLINAYKNDSEYYEMSNLLPTELQKELMVVENEFTCLEEIYKKLKAKREETITKIKQAMEESNITSVETASFKITYVKAREQVGVDSKKLIADHPEIAEKYKKITNVSASLRITTKGVKDE